jgi:hypothetical protein
MTKKITKGLTQTADLLDPIDLLGTGQEDQEDQEDHRISIRTGDPLGGPMTPWDGVPPLNQVQTRTPGRASPIMGRYADRPEKCAEIEANVGAYERLVHMSQEPSMYDGTESVEASGA